MKNDRSTIFALSSGRPPAAIAVVRICGPEAGRVLEKLIGRVPPPRQATLAQIRDPREGEIIDEGLALWFPGPRSEVGEDTAELHLHGGRAVIAAVLDAAGRIGNCRPALAGEFTRRAFDNGRLDLTRVEGLADLIAAETSAQRRQALRQIKGLIGDRAEFWRHRLVEALALVEARIDFTDEADVPENLVRSAIEAARCLRDEIAATLTDARRGERLREGLVVLIAGPPNAGKSTLLNRLARREAAIVSPLPGTTRDVIEVHLDLDGHPVLLLDTAGLHDSADPVEQEGMRRALERAGTADLVLWVIDASAIGPAPRSEVPLPAVTWLLHNKIDLAAGPGPPQTNEAGFTHRPARSFTISAATGAGMEPLVEALSAYADEYFSASEAVIITRARHRRALEETMASLDRALAEGAAGREEVIAEEMRAAAISLGRLTGRVDVEDILDVIFREFCIGK